MSAPLWILRALEVYHVTGVPISKWAAQSHDHSCPLHPVIIGLDFADRTILHQRIAKRVDVMMQDGLLEEVKKLYKSGLSDCRTASAAIGYKELLDYLHGNETLEQAKEKIVIRSRQYAKRQLTWFRRNPDIHWFHVDEYESRLIPSVISLCTSGKECEKNE